MKDNEANIFRKEQRVEPSGTSLPEGCLESSSGVFEDPSSLPSSRLLNRNA
ncbi:MAG: hypothetical protein GY801_26895 [bacterium]|nr:hypothetical protein [bacterium]